MLTISRDELRRLRNDVPVETVIEELRLERSRRGTRRTFCCPRCGTFHTAVSFRTNLARCFRCERNYNPIDLVMLVRGETFLDAVRCVSAIAARVGSGRCRQRPRYVRNPRGAVRSAKLTIRGVVRVRSTGERRLQRILEHRFRAEVSARPKRATERRSTAQRSVAPGDERSREHCCVRR